MKTAISLPNDLFERAEAVAKRLRVSRSELFARAMAEYLERESSSEVTDRLNQLYEHTPARLDESLLRAQLKSIDVDSW